MELIVLIPARSGSKGLRNKNIISIGENNLIKLSYEFATKIVPKNRIILSTDYNFRYFSSFLEKTQYIKRPEFLATDKASIIDVCIDIFEHLKFRDNFKFTDLILLQPTSPFRDPLDLKNALKIYKEKNLKSLASVSPVIQHPYEIIEGKNQNWVSIMDWDGHKNRQLLKQDFFYINGCFYIVNLEFLFLNKSIINKRTYMFSTSNKYTIDIDDNEDLDIAQKLIQ